jgi:hypothetical protein
LTLAELFAHNKIVFLKINWFFNFHFFHSVCYKILLKLLISGRLCKCEVRFSLRCFL